MVRFLALLVCIAFTGLAQRGVTQTSKFDDFKMPRGVAKTHWPARAPVPLQRRRGALSEGGADWLGLPLEVDQSPRHDVRSRPPIRFSWAPRQPWPLT